MDALATTGILALLGPGILIWLGFVVIFAKLKLKTKLKWLAHPVVVDVAVMGIAFWMHGSNTYMGGMAATVAGILTALSTTFARNMFGYIKSGIYYPGMIRYDPSQLQ